MNGAENGAGRGGRHMRRLARMFSNVRGAAFMPYVCCGDPSAAFTVKLVKTLVENGADAIEFGIPFSDPVADGKTIQAASGRALASGMTPKKALAVVARLRRGGASIPIVAMTYYNIVYAAGVQKFANALKVAGGDGLIVPDVPIDESGELAKACRKAGIDLVFLVTPNCTDARLRKIAAKARGFLYAVAVLGITGTRKDVGGDAVRLVKRAKKISKLPVCVGFGISKPEHAKELTKAGADGVIVGSHLADVYAAFMKGRAFDEKKALAAVSPYAKAMKAACIVTSGYKHYPGKGRKSVV